MNRAQLHRDASWLAALLCLFWTRGARAQVTDCSLHLWPGVNMAVQAGWGAILPGGSVPCREDTSHRNSLRSEFGAEVRIFYPSHWQRSWHPDVPRDIVTLVADAIRDTMRRLQPALSAPDINVVLLESVSLTEEGDWSFGTAGVVAGAQFRPCPMAIPIVGIVDRSGGRRAGTRSPERIRETVAHEVYHCYQNEHFREQVDDYVPSHSAWWIEATAVHVANSVYPCNDVAVAITSLYQPAVSIFVQSTRTDRVTGYPSVVFFQHLAEKHRFDLRRLAEFSRTMAPGPGAAPQRRALAAWSGIGEQWHSFARALRDFDVAPCFVDALPVTPSQRTEVRGSQIVRIKSSPFTTSGYHELLFPPNSKYQVRVTDNSGSSDAGPGDPDRVSYRVGRTWKRVDGQTFTVETTCASDAAHLFVATSARADLTPFLVDIEIEDQSALPAMLPGSGCCMETGEHDQCLVGSWRLDKEFMLQQLSTRLPMVSWQMPEGELRTRYRADGRVEGARANLTVKGVMNMRAGPAPFQISVAAQGSGRWSTGRSEQTPVLYACVDSEQATIEKRVEWPHGAVDTSPPNLPGEIKGIAFPYTCRGDTLSLKLPGNVMQQVYRRVRQ